ncbi:hypothetical protein HOY80DRAFT_962179 [Tuber brumale]|nr:hypothetical protein HOY80DRAFT_986477 [Tuber brumale]KAG0639643.1 hypothetical protein HOY80DRAFT_962179 [Tuber brumale]
MKGVNTDQGELVFRPFSGVKVVAQFKAEKRKIDKEGNHVLDTRSPRWGSHTGAGPADQRRKEH